MDDAAFGRLRDRARAGDPEALGALLRGFEDDVRRMVRLRLPRALRGQLDSTDLVQSLYRSLLASAGGRATEFESPGRFLGYLAGMVRFKVLEEYRHRTSQKHDLKREVPLYVREGDREQPRPLTGTEPTPSQHVLADEQLDRLVGAADARQAAIVALRREGWTFEEIAGRLGLSERTVRRVVDQLRASWEREQQA